MTDGLELASGARANVTRVLALLERPSAAALDASAVELASAVARMGQLQIELSDRRIATSTTISAKSAIMALRNDLQRVSVLLRNAWELRSNRGGQVGYSRKGELLRPAPAAVRCALEG